MSKIQKNRWKSMKIANIDRESLYFFLTTWGISMKFLEKMWLMIILKVTKKQGPNLSLEDIFLKNCKGGSIWPPSPAFLGLRDAVWPPRFYYSAKLISFQFQIIRQGRFSVVSFCLHLHSVFVFVFCSYVAKKVIARVYIYTYIYMYIYICIYICICILFKICFFIPFIVTIISSC